MSAAESLRILRERCTRMPALVGETLAEGMDPVPASWRERPCITVGLGSSEAPARLLARLLNEAGVAAGAAYSPLSPFFSGPVGLPGSTLVVFSQGLSPNARIPLRWAEHYGACVVVSAVTPEGLRESGKADAAELLQGILEREGRLVLHPMRDEYTILPRVIGPSCALAAALKLAEAWGAVLPPAPAAAELQEAMATAAPPPGELDGWADDLLGGVGFNFIGAAVDCAHNLAAKVLEGLYRPLPPCRDLFQYAHGPFQVNRVSPAAQWLFRDNAAAATHLAATLAPLFAGSPRPFCEIISPWPHPWDLFYFEAFLNAILLHAVEREGIDLINWPGKGEDGAGYDLEFPHAGAFSG